MEAVMASQFPPLGVVVPTEEDGPSCTIWYIQLQLGRKDYSVAQMCRLVEQLISLHGFPAPFPRLKRGGAITTDVGDKSRWPRIAVDQWLEDWLPPDAAVAAERARQAEAAATMDSRATRLQLVKGGRR
jgi:hypothetical protein